MKPKSRLAFWNLNTISLCLGAGTTVVVLSQSAHAAPYTWNTNAAANWDANASWTPNTGFPNAAGDVANINNNITADVAITLGVPITVGIVNIGDLTSTSNNFTIGSNGGNSLTLNNSGAGAQINFLANGSTDTVAAPIIINDAGGLLISSASGNNRTRTISGGITSTGTGNLTITNTMTNGALQFTTGSINNSGSITVDGSGTVTTTISSLIGVNVTGLTKNGATSGLTLSGANTAFVGTIALQAGTLNINNANALGANSGAGAFTISGGTLSNTLGSTVTLASNNAMNWNGNFSYANTGTNNLNLGTGAVTLGATSTITSTGAGSLTVGGIIGGAFGLTKAGASGGALILTGANTTPNSGYTGLTTVTGGTMQVSGAAASIASSSGLTISGIGTASTGSNGSGLFILDKTAGTAVDALNNSGAISLSTGGEFKLQGTAVTSTETVGTIGMGAGHSTITVLATTSGVMTLAGTDFSRTNLGTGLIRMTSGGLGANSGRVTLSNAQPAGLTLIGGGGSPSTGAATTTKNLAIVPYLLGDTATAGGGSSFVTYDTASGFGLRTLDLTNEYDQVSANGYAVDNNNVRITANNTFAASNRVVNSLLISTASSTQSAGNSLYSLTISSGAMAVSNVFANFGAVGSNWSSVIFGNGEAVINITGNTTNFVSPINVTSGGGLTKAGAGTLVLAASNLYTGQTTVNQGTLQIGTGTAGDLGSNTANIVLNGGNLSFGRTNAGLTLVNNISGIGGVTQNGAAGITVLSGTNTHSGTTTITSGTLRFLALPGNTTAGVSAAMSANSALSLAAGTTLQLRGDSSTTFNSGAISVPAAGASTAVTFDVGTNGAATSGNVYTLSGTFNAVNVSQGGGTNSLTFNVTDTTGNSSNLSIGSLQLTTSGNNGNFFINPTTGNLILAGLIGSANNATVTTFTGSGNTTATGSIQQGAGRGLTLNLNQTGTVNLNGVNTNGTFFSFNNGTTVLNNNSAINTASNFGTTAATANNVSVLLGGTNATGTVAGTNGGITNANTWAARDADTGLLTLGGQNTSGTNTFSNTITLGVTLNTGKSLNLVSAAGGQVDFTNTVALNGTDTTAGVTINGTYTVNGGTVTPTGTVRLSGANTYRGVTTIVGGTLLADSVNALNTTALGGNVTFTGGTLKLGSTFNAGANADISARIKNSTGAVSIDTNALTRTFATAIDSSNTGGLTKLNTGTLTLSAANTYTGTTTVSGGTLQASGSGTFGNVNNGLTVNTGGILDLNNTSQGVGALNGTGGSITNVVGTVGIKTLTVGNNNATGGSYAGVISDSGNATGTLALTKVGTGTQTLTGTNTYTGTTTVSAGKLILGDAAADTFATTQVNVASGATLGGSGIIAGNVTLAVESSGGANDGGTLAAGNSPGTLVVDGTTTFNDGSIFSWDISSDGASYDKLDTSSLVDGGAVGGSIFQIVLADTSFTDNFWDNTQTWTNIFSTDGTTLNAIADWADIFSTVTVVNSSFGPATPVDGSFSISGSTLTWSAVPEPTSALAGLLLGAGLLRRRRKI